MIKHAKYGTLPKFITGGRTRTDTGLPPSDFESDASTNFTTPATYPL